MDYFIFYVWFHEFCVHSGVQLSISYVVVEEFSQFAFCCFVLLNVSFVIYRFIRFRRCHLLILLSVPVLLVLYIGSGQFCSNVQDYFPLSLQWSWMCVCFFMFKSFIQLELNFVHWDRYESICIPRHTGIHLCQQYLLKILCYYSV